MNNQEKENLRIALLRVLDANGSGYGLAVEALGAFLPRFGFTGTPAADIERELAYLADKAMATTIEKKLSPANKVWRITAEGRDWVETQS